MDDSRPVFAQIMEIIEDGIITGIYAADDIIISTTHISELYSVNPTTAVKAVSRLADDGILYKKPGIGMCVANGAREKIINRRKKVFLGTTMNKLLAEAKTLGIPADELIRVIKRRKGANKHDRIYRGK